VAIAGPAAIAAAVLYVLRDVAFGGLISGRPDTLDPLSFFLPMNCFLGRSIADGHIPAWNPHVMLGVPFASDPQSGWMSLLPMALFSTLPCATAIRWLIVLLPVIGGVGMYGFLRSESLGRIAATAGGASIALAVAGSRLAMSLPFSGSLAWTAVTLWAASRTLWARSWTARLIWSLVTAIAWGQVLAAHLAHGTIVGTGALIAYVAGRTLHDLRRDRATSSVALALLLVLATALVTVNLAFLLPRLGAYPRTTLSLGYEELNAFGAPPDYEESQGLDADWIFKFASSPGLYAGGGIVLLSFGGALSRRLRYLFWTICAFALLSYLLSLTSVFRLVTPLFTRVPFAEQVFLHKPWRYSLALIVALPILGAVGLQAWIEEMRLGMRVAILVLGGAAWLVLPLVLGVDGIQLLLATVAAVLIVGALLIMRLRPVAGALVVLLVICDLVMNGWMGRVAAEASPADRSQMVVGSKPSSWLLTSLPNINVERYVSDRDFQEPIRGSEDRFVTLSRYFGTLRPSWSASLGDQRAILFRLEDVNGYNPVQLVRYWRFIREVNAASAEARTRPLKYNRTQLLSPTERILNLLDVGWIIRRTREAAPPRWRLASRDGRWSLFRRASEPRASVIGRWRVARSSDEALEAVVHPRFDPGRDLVLEGDPGIPSSATGEVGVARFRWLTGSTASIDVEADRPAIVLIRNAFDAQWRATVDGEPARVLPADYLLQGVAVGPGQHVIHLSYDDPWIRRGLIGSVAASGLILAFALALDRRDRRRSRPAPASLDAGSPEAGVTDEPEELFPTQRPSGASDG
jgi:hypothetical protein